MFNTFIEIGPLFSGIVANIDFAIVAATILGGLAWGRIYNRHLNIPPGIIYHKFMTGSAYLLIILLSRLAVEGEIGPLERWLGYIILWGVFCLAIRIGQGTFENTLINKLKGGDRADKESDI